ncbi:MAG: AMP-binding protein, partial [Terriglobales bacterium]
MNFLENILQRLARDPARVVLQEVHDGKLVSATAGDLLAVVGAARAFLHSAGVGRGDRCALLAGNSIRWTALDLAIMAEGAIVVQLYARQSVKELVGMMRDCTPSLLCCGDAALRDAVRSEWPEMPRVVLFDDIFTAQAGDAPPPVALADPDP